MDGELVADGIEVDAGWASADCLAIRAEDEDEVCEMTEEIARRLRDQLGNIRTKTAPKISSWVLRQQAQIKKLGIKTLDVAEIRPWPDSNAGASERISSGAEGESSQPETVAETKEPPLGTEADDTAAGLRSRQGRNRSTDTHENTDEIEAPNDKHSQGRNSEAREGQSLSAPSHRYRGHRSYPKSVDTRSRPDPLPSQSRATNIPAPQSGERMRSYVEHSLNRKERERQRAETRAAGDAAEEFVVAKEIKAGRDARRLGGNHPGYDIVSKSKEGIVTRYIEVKSIAGSWGGTGVRLTPTQFVSAEHFGEEYWLYVVENAKTDGPIIHAIQNPAAHISAFCFDCGWREIAEVGTKERPASLFIPKEGDTVIFDEQEVVVEKVETRGAFVLATFKVDGRTYRKMNTALAPKE